MAHKLARIVYRMLHYRDGYIDKAADFYDEKFRQQQILALKKRAATRASTPPGLRFLESPPLAVTRKTPAQFCV
jgi:hypothetical protein